MSIFCIFILFLYFALLKLKFQKVNLIKVKKIEIKNELMKKEKLHLIVKPFLNLKLLHCEVYLLSFF